MSEIDDGITRRVFLETAIVATGAAAFPFSSAVAQTPSAKSTPYRLFIEGSLANVQRARALAGVRTFDGIVRNAGSGRVRVGAEISNQALIQAIQLAGCTVTILSTPRSIPATPVRTFYSNYADIVRDLNAFAAARPTIASIANLPNVTASDRRRVVSLRLGKPTAPVKVLVMGGMHADEWPPPTAIVKCIGRLVDAYRDPEPHNAIQIGGITVTGKKGGGLTVTATEVKAIFDTLHVTFVPLVNPDGYERSLTATTDDMKTWRKNWSGVGKCRGVDLNRNFDVTWDVLAHYTPEFIDENGELRNACDENYMGPTAFSEPESKNILALAKATRFHYSLDCHCDGEQIGHPWGVVPSQSWNPLGHTFEATMGRKSWDEDYHLYLPRADRRVFRAIGKEMRRAIQQARSIRYGIADIAKALEYCSPGNNVDYLYTTCGTWAMVGEFGPDRIGSQPDNDDLATRIDDEIQAAVLGFLRYAATKPVIRPVNAPL